ncbi:MAG TPA: nucleotidyltransferase family protein [Anaerolineae bacterium]|nr:nucleotidyltransferase family protein [Anaerolineae bacterium]
MISLVQLCHTMVAWLTEPPASDPGWAPDTEPAFKLTSRVHGVAPLLYEQLHSVAWLDAALKSWLARQADLNRQRVARMQAELHDILVSFAHHEVAVMPLKGSILSAGVYDHPGQRPLADLDLLVRPADFERAGHLLQQLGYEPTVAHWKHTEFIKPDNRTVASTEFEHPDNPRKVELHRYCRESFGGPGIDLTDGLWQQARPGELLGQPAFIPEPEALWLHLLVHHTYHAWQGKARLIQLVDLARLTPRLAQPASLVDRIDARYTYPSLALLQRYFPTAIDNSLVAAQQARVSTRFQTWVGSLDLINTSHLAAGSPGLYLSKALRFSEGRPNEVVQALRFALLPRLEEIGLDHPQLAQSKVPWLAYCLLPLDWAKRLRKKPPVNQKQEIF